MAEVVILALVKPIVNKIGGFVGDHVVTKIQDVMSAKNDLNIIAEKLEAIRAVLADAEERQYANNAIKVWVRGLKSLVYDIDDFLDELATDALLRRVNEGHLSRQLWYYLSLSNILLNSRSYLSYKVNILRVKLENIVATKNDFNLTECPVEISSDEIRDPLDRCSHVHETAIVGRDAAKRAILNILSNVSEANGQLSVLCIVGMGGIGKTALAKLVYKDVLDFDLKLWACVSDKFRLQKIIEDIVKDASGDQTPSSQDINKSIKRLHKLLWGRKYFLVLDDCWEDDFAKWSKLKDILAVGKAGSIILITTRSNHVAYITGTVEPYNLDSLPVDMCWSIFKQLAFLDGEEERYKELVKIGRSIVEKCNGIPLVVKSLATMLRSERDEQQWQKIKDMNSFVGLPGQYEEVMSILKLSYNKLPSHLKPCFAYLSLFVKDTPLYSALVIYLWSALGLLQLTHDEIEFESRGYSYFVQLVSRSLLHESDLELNNLYLSECKMHDMMHDLAMNILGEEVSIVTQDKMDISKYTRHLIWGHEGLSKSLNETTFFKKLSRVTPNIRSFKFGYQMNDVSWSFLKVVLSQFPYLRILDLSDSQFEELPKTIGNLKHLRFLDLSYNCKIKCLPNSICNLLNLETFYLFGCEQLSKLPHDIYLMHSLRTFTVTSTLQEGLETKFNELKSLQYLNFSFCERLTSLWDNHNAGHLTSLRFLFIDSCPKLTSLPESMKFLTSLETLFIKDCEMLDVKQGKSLQGLRRLRQLLVEGVPKLDGLPSELLSSSASLQDFFIVNCRGLMEIPGWLQRFTSLRRVKLSTCPKISALPECFQHLTSVQELYISDCPQLSQHCAVPNGKAYLLIQHIPKFFLDGVAYTGTPTR